VNYAIFPQNNVMFLTINTLNFVLLKRFKNNKMKQLLILIALIALIISCKKKQENIKVTAENITESVYASGIVKSKNQYRVFSTISGLIERVFCGGRGQ
jgi:hypothetical protein